MSAYWIFVSVGMFGCFALYVGLIAAAIKFLKQINIRIMELLDNYEKNQE